MKTDLRPRCHHCGALVSIKLPHFQYRDGTRRLYWHGFPLQCIGKDIVYIALCIERTVL